MNLKHPEFLPLLLLIPLLIAFYYFSFKRRLSVLDQLCDLSKIANLFPYSSRIKTFTRYFFVFLAFVMIIVSLISPRWGYDWVEVKSEGTNIIIAVDLSTSMLAEDVSPSRLTRAKLEVNKLIDKLTGDKLGLIIFAGSAFLQSPLTHDYLMVKDWVGQLSTDLIETPGTSIKAAIDEAVRAFSIVESESKVLILISDGEEQDEQTIEAAELANSVGIKIYCIGVGSQKGAPIKLANGGLLKDQSGNIVISKLDDDLLKQIAKITDGDYVRSATGDFHLDQIYYQNIKRMNASETLKSGKSKQWYETYQIFMAIALFCLVFELLLSLNLGIYFWFTRLLRKGGKNVYDLS